MDADDASVIDIDIDGDRPSGTRTVSNRHRALILIKHIALVALILIIYITLHEFGHAMACELARGYTLEEIEVLNVRVYPVFGAGEGWRKLSTRFGETRCVRDVGLSSTKTHGVILMSGFIFTSILQVIALISSTCGFLPYGIYCICPDFLYYATSPKSEFQQGLSLTRPAWLMQLTEPDDPETLWTSYNTAFAIIVLTLGIMFFYLQTRQLLKARSA